MKIWSQISKYSFAPAHYVFLGAALVRLVTIGQLVNSPFLLPSRGDMHFYDDWAHRILHGAPAGDLAFYGLPLYPYLLAGIYKFFGHSPFLPALLQVLLDSGTAVLIYQLTRAVVQSASAPFEPLPAVKHLPEVAAVFGAAAWTFFLSPPRPTQ